MYVEAEVELREFLNSTSDGNMRSARNMSAAFATQSATLSLLVSCSKQRKENQASSRVCVFVCVRVRLILDTDTANAPMKRR
jgi:hypothetical protein